MDEAQQLGRIHGLLVAARDLLHPSRASSPINVDVARAHVEEARGLAERLMIRLLALVARGAGCTQLEKAVK